VLIVGLDGGTFKKLRPWLLEGKLPLLSRLYSEGVRAQLKTFFPTLSPLEWACFYTGKKPGKLGLFALSHVEDLKDPDKTWHVIDSTVIESTSLWKILSDQRIRVGVVNIPATYPPEKVDGFLISGYLTPPSAKDFFYPETIKQFLEGYRIESEFEYLRDESINTDRLLEDLHDVAQRRNNAIISLLQAERVDFLALNVKEVDTLQHVFWDNDSTLEKFMSFVDNLLSKLVDEFKPSHIIIMSDHGFHERETEYFYINTWLQQRGLLKNAGLRSRFWASAYRLAIAWSKRSTLIRRIVVSKKDSVAKFASRQIDVSDSKVYASQWGIFFSQEMRSKPDYAEVRAQLREDLLAVRSPSGAKVFEHVFFREELFQGPYLEKFPDIIPIPAPRFLINANMFGEVFDERMDRPYLKGSHKSDPDGIFILHGEGVRRGADLGTIALTDLAPTTLFLYGLTAPPDMDGHVISQAFTDEFISSRKAKETILATHEEKARRVYSAEEQEQMLEHLRRLGYV
jgi:predicted AlkP superfamily phosphohydrolase/phosphomutase